MNATEKSPTGPGEHCPRCGARLPAGALSGLCLACLLKQGVAPDTATQGAAKVFEPPPVSELSRLFPQLEIISLLGKGGMGAVYKARQPALDRLVALKILPRDEGPNPGFAERFTREARALARLSHPNIVAVHEFGEVDGLHYFVMEYVDGVNLRQLEKTSRLAPREALQLIPQICDALQYAHDEGVVHRDIKPENVLVDRKGRVKIADFGLAKILGREPQDFRLTGEGQIMGTLHYMAPEQVERPLEVDHRADIFSLGVVFYEMLTGELPLGKFAPPSRKVQVDVRLDEIVLQTLEKEPERRYQQASQVKTAVQQISGKSAPMPRWAAGVDYKSKRCLWGWPLIHVATGIDPDTGKQRVAKGIIAIGGNARGGLAIGGMAMGFFACGGLALGVVSFGGLGIGLLAVGGMALGLLAALGGGAAAPIAIGGGSVGYFAYGGGSYGVHAYSALHIDPVAWDFFEPWVRSLLQWGWMANFYIVGMVVLTTLLLPIWLARRKAGAPGWPVLTLGIVLGTAVVSFITLLPKPFLRNLNPIRYLLTGTVQDAQTGRPLGGARIFVDGVLRPAGSSPWEPWTSDNGRFQLTTPTRKPTLTIWAPGYGTNTVPIQPEAFSSKGRAEQHVKLERQRSASMETWAPAPGEEASPDKVLTEAKELTDKHRYEEALQRILWYFNHALEYQPSLSGVRLSFALSSWTELGRRYPKARQAMVETRDRDLATFSSGQGYFDLFMELDALNRELDQENASLELFKRLHSEDKRLARQCYAIVESLLVNQGDYQLCTNYITNPQAKFETIRTNWEHLKQMETNWARSQQESRRSSEQMRAKLRERYPNLPESPVTWTTPTPPQTADKSLVTRTCELIEILVATYQTDAAKNIRDQAIALVDDPKLKSSLEDAKARIATK